MQGFSLGAGLASLAFWGFLASIIVAGIWYDSRKRESQHETVRRLFESGQPIDDAMMDKLLSLSGDKRERLDRNFKVVALIMLPAAVGPPWCAVLILEPPLVLFDRSLQTGFGQGGEAGKSLPQRRQAVQVAPDDTQHFAVAEAPQACFEAMLPDGCGETRDIR